MWFSHKLADALSSRGIQETPGLIDHVRLGEKERPNHVEFAENKNGKLSLCQPCPHRR
jgi:hypothetical protein